MKFYVVFMPLEAASHFYFFILYHQ